MNSDLHKQIELAAEALRNARNPVLLSGAGISAESGVPTFRGKEGLWRNFRPEELATPQAFQKEPQLIWEWYNWRKGLVASKEPNAGHLAATRLQEILGMEIITQNVDGLHTRAGARDVIEMHGNIFETLCTTCKKTNKPSQSESTTVCTCGGALRPNVVWFGESLNQKIMERIYSLLDATSLLIVVGTSGVVMPAASFASIVKQSGGRIIEINPENPSGDFALKGMAGEILPKLVSSL